MRAGARAPDHAMDVARSRHHGEMHMNAMDVLGLLLIVFLVAPMVTARPNRY
jgi:hypothetical protein